MRAVCAVLGLWLLGGASALAAAPLSLSEALARAEHQNAELRAARSAAEADGQRGAAAARMYWPRVSVAADYSRTDNPARVFASRLNRGELTAEDLAVDRLNTPSALGHFVATATVDLPLDIFGKVRAQAQTARAVGRASDSQVEEARQDLRLRVIEAYRRAVLAAAALDVTRRAQEGARARESQLEARVAEGGALRADLLRARARRRRREADLAEREGERRVALAGLALLIGARADEAVEPNESVTAPGPLTVELPSATEQAVHGRAALRAAGERLSAATWTARGTRRARLPDLGLYAQAQNDRGSLDSGRTSTSVGLTMRWNVFDAPLWKRAEAAAADERAARATLDGALEQIRLETAMAFERARAAREQHAAAAGGAEEGREALRVIQERRASGMATLTDELETEAASLAAELEELRAATEAAVADAALQRAMGTL